MGNMQADRCGRGLEVRAGAVWFGVKEMTRSSSKYKLQPHVEL